METAGNDVDDDARCRSAVSRHEMEDASIRRDQTMHADSVITGIGLSPLINTMRAFGLYFTRGPHVVPESTRQPVREGVRRCSNWNAGRIYATIMLAVMWLNAVRISAIFDGRETLGSVLFTKIAILPESLLLAILHTAYYVASHTGSLSVSMATTRPHLTVADILAMSEEDLRIECLRLEIPASGLDKSAIPRQLLGHIVARATSTPASHTGSLDRVFSRADSSVAKLSAEYSRRVKVVMVVCWITMALNVITEVYSFIMNEGAGDQLPLLLVRTFRMPSACLEVIKVLVVILNLLASISWTFPQAVN